MEWISVTQFRER